MCFCLPVLILLTAIHPRGTLLVIVTISSKLNQFFKDKSQVVLLTDIEYLREEDIVNDVLIEEGLSDTFIIGRGSEWEKNANFNATERTIQSSLAPDVPAPVTAVAWSDQIVHKKGKPIRWMVAFKVLGKYEVI